MKNVLDILLRAQERRSQLWEDSTTDAFRLCNGEGDGAGSLFIDRYGEFILVQGYDPESCLLIEAHPDIFIEYAKSLPVSIKGVLYKNRDERAGAQKDYTSVLLSGDMPPEKHIVKQSGISVRVDCINGLNTGLFLDMREVRDSLKAEYSSLTSMLNLFSYTGMFALQARLHGVRGAVNVDVSQTVLKRAMANYTLNGLTPDGRDFVQEDCGRWLRRSEKREMMWDITVFDPPTFARGKTGSFSVKNDYRAYLSMIESVTRRYVLSVINTHTVSSDEYISHHPKAWKNIWLKNESSDFPYARDPYLKVGLWRLPEQS